MHSLHDYVSTRLRRKLKDHRVVVMYDPREEFAPYIRELNPAEDETVSEVQIDGESVQLAQFDGSFFALRAAVEPRVGEDEPELLLVYLPGVERDREGSVLMEVEKAGTCYEPQLKRLARHVLRETHTEGQIDKYLAPEKVGYDDIRGLLSQAGEGSSPSMLRTIFDDAKGEELVAKWVADDEKDQRIREKSAEDELYELIQVRLGLSLPAKLSLDEARQRMASYLLLGEFRADLQAEEPSTISMIAAPSTKDARNRTHTIAELLRRHHSSYYETAADGIETDFNLARCGLDAENLGAIDTFRFEATLMLQHAADLVAEGAYDEALDVITLHRESYWVQRSASQQAQWEACRLMAELGAKVEDVRRAIQKADRNVRAWIDAYSAEDGWHRMDAAQRSLEAFVASMGEEPQAEQALGKVRRTYEILVHRMAEQFTEIFAEAGWTHDGAFTQTEVFGEEVDRGAGKTAYFLVDALRYEMAVDLIGKLNTAEELLLRPAVAALPTVTVVGMAALIPGASGSFSVVEEKGDLAARIEGSTMTGLKGRLKHLEAKVPDLVDLKLDDVLQAKTGRLQKKLGSTSLVLVRSQEIDALGEGGFEIAARQSMASIVGNVERAVRKLANAGVERFVLAADHGHLFGLSKGEDMRIDAPGGETVKLTRRCWAGRGGKTPAGTIRVQGAELGYDTDLEFVFPKGAGVFRGPGGLSFHHGGTSLQELIVPVVSFRMSQVDEKKTGGPNVEVSSAPAAVTNRTFLVGLKLGKDLFTTEPIPLRVLLLSGNEQVGEAKMASKAEIDESRGVVVMEPGSEATVGLILTREDCETVRVVIQDPESGRVHAQTDEIPVELGI